MIVAIRMKSIAILIAIGLRCEKKYSNIVGITDYENYCNTFCNTFCNNFPNMLLLSANVKPNSAIIIRTVF